MSPAPADRPLRALLLPALAASVACAGPVGGPGPVGGASAGTPAPAPEPPALAIELEHGTDEEARTAQQLQELVRTFDLDRWILTRDVRIDGTAIPHSHPVLTLHTRYLGHDTALMSAFVHEQLHWLEDGETREAFHAAMAEYRELWPDPPPSSEGGARDDRSTWRHLLVNDMEYQAMTTLVGPERARERLAGIPHYAWIYDRVLNDPRVREIALRHGFDVREGVPGR